LLSAIRLSIASSTERTRRAPAAAELAGALEDVLDDGDDEVVLGRKVVRLRPSGDASGGGDVGGPEPRVALACEQVDRRIEDAPAHVLGPFGLGTPDPGRSDGGRCHSIALPPLTLITWPVTNEASRDAM
jgi:hypothetical protein